MIEVAAVAMIVIFLVAGGLFFMMNAGEAKNIAGALEQEKKRCETMSFDQLEDTANKEATSRITFNNSTFLRKLETGVTDHGDMKSLRVRITVQGLRNKQLVESAAVTKQKEKKI